jgi:hypothetical protein
VTGVLSFWEGEAAKVAEFDSALLQRGEKLTHSARDSTRHPGLTFAGGLRPMAVKLHEFPGAGDHIFQRARGFPSQQLLGAGGIREQGGSPGLRPAMRFFSSCPMTRSIVATTSFTV